MPQMPYNRKVKKNKREGLGLFEKYYVSAMENKPSAQVASTNRDAGDSAHIGDFDFKGEDRQ